MGVYYWCFFVVLGYCIHWPWSWIINWSPFLIDIETFFSTCLILVNLRHWFLIWLMLYKLNGSIWSIATVLSAFSFRLQRLAFSRRKYSINIWLCGAVILIVALLALGFAGTPATAAISRNRKYQSGLLREAHVLMEKQATSKVMNIISGHNRQWDKSLFALQKTLWKTGN